MLDRKELYEAGVCYHSSYRTHFFTKNEAKKRRADYFRTENFENEIIYEVPINGVQWALNLLNIKEWPATADFITRAFRVAAMNHHPDRGGNAEMFVKCKTAQEVLLNHIRC